MGYRPTFRCLDSSNLEFYGTKLFGYVDERKCLSYQYLAEIRKIDPGEVVWDYCCDNRMVLTAPQFAIFAMLYEHDMNMYSPYFKGTFKWDAVEHGIVNEIIARDCDKEVYWC